MPIETFDYVGNLNASNPVATDPEGEGDDHIRGIKAALKNTLGALTGAVTATHTQLNQLASGIITFAAGTSGSPSVIIGDAASAFYRVSSGIIGIVGRLSGNGAVDAGAMYYFPKAAPGGMASGGTATGSERYALCDGATYNVSTFPALGAYLGSTYGGDGVNTFAMPNVANRFLRGAGGSIAVGTTQADAIKTHSAALNGTAASHVHGVNDPGHPHTSGSNGATSGVVSGASPPSTGATVGGAVSINSNTTGISIQASGALALSGTADYTGDTETRPAAFAAYVCLKT